jgi:hypothetical protein
MDGAIDAVQLPSAMLFKTQKASNGQKAHQGVGNLQKQRGLID